MAGMTNDEEERETPQPHIAADIDKIAPLVAQDGQIHKAEERAQKARSDLGNLYQKIENDFHGNRKAVKLVRSLMAGTTDAAYDFVRTFLRLAARFDLLPADDLVDLAEQAEAGTIAAGLDDSGISSADLAPKSAKVLDHPARENAIDRAKKALEGGGKPAPDGPPGDTDLVEAGEEVAAEIEAQRRKDSAAFDEAQAT